MHQYHRQIEPPLKRTNVRQQFRHLSRIVLVNTVESDERIEEQQSRAEPLVCLMLTVVKCLPLRSDKVAE